MGQGTTLNIINGTPYNWSQTSSTSQYMNNWNFPGSVNANSISTTYIEWDEEIFHDEDTDVGSCAFSIDGTNSNFSIDAKYDGSRHIMLNLSGMSTLNQSQGDVVDLGWVWNQTGYPHYNSMTVIISGVDGRFICNSENQLRLPWLNVNLPTLGQRTMREICIPASHDSGMSTIGARTAFADALNCKTQVNNIAGQLGFGIRMFDIRPVVSGGDYFCGHYSHIDETLNWQGADGQKITDVVNDVNSFTATNPELVILHLSHAYDTDNHKYPSFNQDNWNGLFSQLAGLNHLFVAPPNTSDLTTMTLNQFIGNNSAAVLLVFDDLKSDGTTPNLGSNSGNGFYYGSQFSFYDQYANSDDPNRMMSNQFAKLQAQRTSPDSQMFNLSFTLTQQPADTVFGPSILHLAATAEPYLAPKALPQCNSIVYPNLIDMDNINDSIPVAVAAAINCLAAGSQSMGDIATAKINLVMASAAEKVEQVEEVMAG